MKNLIRIFEHKVNPLPELIAKEFFCLIFGMKFGVTMWNQKGGNKGFKLGFYNGSLNFWKFTFSWDEFSIKRVDRHLTEYYSAK